MSETPSSPDRAPALDDPVTVVIVGRNRAARLALTLAAVLDATGPDVRVIVVDATPADDTVEELVRGLAASEGRVAYVREALPGLARARNRGLDEARTPLVVFLDDDVLPRPGHVERLCAPFAGRPDVWCVAGPVHESSTGAHRDTATGRRELGRATRPWATPLLTTAVATFVTRGNLAVRTARLRSLRGFDVRLGPDTPARGGEEIDAAARLVRAGGTVVHEPTAAVDRQAGPEAEQVERRHDDRTGLGAAAGKQLLNPVTAIGCLVRLPVAVATGRPDGDRRDEAAGIGTLATGALAYIRSLVGGGTLRP